MGNGSSPLIKKLFPNCESKVFIEKVSGSKGESKSYMQEKLRHAARLVKSVSIRQEILVVLTRQVLEFQNDSLIDQSTQPLPKGLTTIAKSRGPSLRGCMYYPEQSHRYAIEYYQLQLVAHVLITHLREE